MPGKFEQLISQAEALTQSQKIELYISGLLDHIAVKVEFHHPPDLATTISISCLYEHNGEPSWTPLVEVRQTKKLGLKIICSPNS